MVPCDVKVFNASIVFDRYGDNPDPDNNMIDLDVLASSSYYLMWAPPSNFSRIGLSTYNISIYPVRRGFYNLNTYVCERAEDNSCQDITEFTELAISPQVIYLTTKHPNYELSEAYGTGLYYCVVSNRESFYIQLRDKYSNFFDVWNAQSDFLKTVGPTDYIDIYITVGDSKVPSGIRFEHVEIV
jgi:hypothetical protein